MCERTEKQLTFNQMCQRLLMLIHNHGKKPYTGSYFLNSNGSVEEPSSTHFL